MDKEKDTAKEILIPLEGLSISVPLEVLATMVADGYVKLNNDFFNEASLTKDEDEKRYLEELARIYGEGAGRIRSALNYIQTNKGLLNKFPQKQGAGVEKK